MKLQEKIAYLQINNLSEWLKTRKCVEGEISSSQSMFCVCRRLATGLHESNCRKFQSVVSKETVKRLKHLMINA